MKDKGDTFSLQNSTLKIGTWYQQKQTIVVYAIVIIIGRDHLGSLSQCGIAIGFILVFPTRKGTHQVDN